MYWATDDCVPSMFNCGQWSVVPWGIPVQGSNPAMSPG